MEKLHVGYVLKKFPRLSETFILNEVLELERQGVQVTIFSLHRPDDGVFHRQLADLDAPVIYMAPSKRDLQLESIRQAWPLMHRQRDRVWSEIEALLNSGRPDVWNLLRWGMEIALAAKARGIDRLHAHFATVASYAARAAHAVAGLPFSFTCHAKDIYRAAVDAEEYQRLARDADLVVTVCEANREFIERRLAGDANLPLVTLYNGIDLDRFRANAEGEAQEEEDLPILLSVGRLVPKKGFDDLVAAAASLLNADRRFRCVIIGDGEDREQLAGMIAELGVSGIEMLGPQPQEVVCSYMRRASMFVLPCRIAEDGNRDALPTVLLEAIASGVPVISTPVGGIAEILDEGRAGVLTPCSDRPALARCIAELLDDEKRRAELSRLGRARAVSHFDLHKNIADLRRYFLQGSPHVEQRG